MNLGGAQTLAKIIGGIIGVVSGILLIPLLVPLGALVLTTNNKAYRYVVNKILLDSRSLDAGGTDKSKFNVNKMDLMNARFENQSLGYQVNEEKLKMPISDSLPPL